MLVLILVDSSLTSTHIFQPKPFGSVTRDNCLTETDTSLEETIYSSCILFQTWTASKLNLFESLLALYYQRYFWFTVGLDLEFAIPRHSIFSGVPSENSEINRCTCLIS